MLDLLKTCKGRDKICCIIQYSCKLMSTYTFESITFNNDNNKLANNKFELINIK